MPGEKARRGGWDKDVVSDVFDAGSCVDNDYSSGVSEYSDLSRTIKTNKEFVYGRSRRNIYDEP